MKKGNAAKKTPARQKQLPTMEDHKIASIENAALEYAEARDERQAANVIEKQKKTKLLAEMKSQGKKAYHRGEIHADILPEGEKLRVRIGKPKEDEEDEDDE